MTSQTTITPEKIVQIQLDTYNSRDIEGFMSVMHPEVMLFEFQNSHPKAAGFDEVKTIYSTLFEQSPKLHSELENRIVLGNKVIDHEKITGRLGSTDIIELVVIYELDDGKIKTITVIRP